MAPHSVDDLARSFERHLQAENRSPRTVETDLEAVNQLVGRLRTQLQANGGAAWPTPEARTSRRS